MKLTLDILKVIIIQNEHTDLVCLNIDKKDGCWPYKNELSLQFKVAHGYGPQYVEKELFPDSPSKKLEALIEIIVIDANRIPFSSKEKNNG